jgi:hypothetical protein
MNLLQYVLEKDISRRAQAGWMPYGPPLQDLRPLVAIPPEWGNKYVFANLMGGGLSALLSGSGEYVGIVAAAPDLFAAEINKHMKVGFVLLGHAVFSNDMYYQAMVPFERGRFIHEALKMWGVLSVDHFMEEEPMVDPEEEPGADPAPNEEPSRSL